MQNDIITVANVRGYLDEDSTAWLNAEDVARGFGFTQAKNGVEYVRWETVNNYLNGFGFSQQVGKGNYLSENMVYCLGFKANNETAARFQSILAYEVLPSIRRMGANATSFAHSDISVELERANRTIRNLCKENEHLIDDVRRQGEAIDLIINAKGAEGIDAKLDFIIGCMGRMVKWFADAYMVSATASLEESPESMRLRKKVGDMTAEGERYYFHRKKKV